MEGQGRTCHQIERYREVCPAACPSPAHLQVDRLPLQQGSPAVFGRIVREKERKSEGEE